MKVKELLASCYTTLQDHDKNYWDDSEMLDYFNECIRVLASERTEKKQQMEIILNDLSSSYNVDGVLRFVSAVDNEGTSRSLYPDDGSGDDDNNGIIVQDYDQIFVNDPTVGTEIYISYITMPEPSNLEEDVRVGDEVAIKFYILARALEKDTDMQNWDKASYFDSKFETHKSTILENTNVNYQDLKVKKVVGYYF